jgi:hypothetical protein
MRRALSIIFALCIALSVSEGHLLAGRESKPRRIAGVTRDEGGKLVPAEVLSFRSSGLEIAVRYLDGPQRRSALSSVLGRELALFTEPSESSKGHLVFALEIRNGGQAELLFEPGQSRLVTNKLDAEIPLDYTMLHMVLSRSPHMEVSLEDLEDAVFSRATSVKPGGAVRKLLVFDSPMDPTYKKFEIRLGDLNTAGGSLDATFKFKRFKVKE